MIDSNAVTAQFQVPYSASVVVRLQVETPNGLAETEVRIATLAPALFPLDPQLTVAPGAASDVFATGLGALAGDLPAAPLALAMASNYMPVTPIATALPGVYRLDYTVPLDAPEGNVELRLNAGDEWSGPLFVPVVFSPAQSA